VNYQQTLLTKEGNKTLDARYNPTNPSNQRRYTSLYKAETLLTKGGTKPSTRGTTKPF